jgi:aspartyl-tRNA(Asn)/glutamyl-tRNA(Gln) amidotransferase subunit A
VTSQLWRDGAVMLGKLNNDEFAMGSSNETSCFGPVVNPWRRKGSNVGAGSGGQIEGAHLVPGGSSGGSASAVAARLCLGATATDTGGSIRQPAAFTGTVGLKPTYGRCSRWGIVAFASSLDQAGPFTRDVTDAALLLGAMVGEDPRDSTSIRMPEPIALPSATDLQDVRPGVLERFNATLDLARELGATVETMRLPHAPHALAAYYILAPAEASSNLARYDGVRYGYRAEGNDLTEVYERTRNEGFGDEPKRRIMLGTYALSAGYYDAYYGKAQQVRTMIIREHAEVFERFDLIVSATSPSVAFPIGDKAADPLAMYACDLLTIPSCVAGLPGLSIPCGMSEGLPVGLQLIGPQLAENRLFRAGYALERALEFDYVPERLR